MAEVGNKVQECPEPTLISCLGIFDDATNVDK